MPCVNIGDPPHTAQQRIMCPCPWLFLTSGDALPEIRVSLRQLVLSSGDALSRFARPARFSMHRRLRTRGVTLSRPGATLSVSTVFLPVQLTNLCHSAETLRVIVHVSSPVCLNLP